VKGLISTLSSRQKILSREDLSFLSLFRLLFAVLLRCVVKGFHQRQQGHSASVGIIPVLFLVVANNILPNISIPIKQSSIPNLPQKCIDNPSFFYLQHSYHPPSLSSHRQAIYRSQERPYMHLIHRQ
jgi:hypothetical protein